MTPTYKKLFIVLSLLLITVIFLLIDIPSKPTQPELSSPRIILQRLNVTFLGQDGHKVIGSGCPGTDGKGEIIDYHFIVENVDETKNVERIIVTGDNSTLTWELPCTNDWALSAENLENGDWEIFIAPSLYSKVYTILFFYDDNTFTLGMTTTP